jgi:hypothetical protein
VVSSNTQRTPRASRCLPTWQISITERLTLGAALDLAAQGQQGEPIIPDVLAQLADPPPELLRIAATATVEEFGRELRDLINSLGLLCQGAIRGMFDRDSSVIADLSTPAMSLDISALDDEEVVAAAMLCSWAWAAAMIDGAAALGQRRNVVRVQEELWRACGSPPASWKCPTG